MLQNNVPLAAKLYGTLNNFPQTLQPHARRRRHHDCDVSVAVRSKEPGAVKKVSITLYKNLLKRLNWSLGDRIYAAVTGSKIVVTLVRVGGYTLTSTGGRRSDPNYTRLRNRRVQLTMPATFPIEAGNYMDFIDPVYFRAWLILETVPRQTKRKQGELVPSDNNSKQRAP